jgi:FtsP/CotA-like multicopper oxidase with cupredoxin domain
MDELSVPRELSRRDFIKLGGGLLGAVTSSDLLSKVLLQPEKVTESVSLGPVAEAASPAQLGPPDLHLAASDGWIYLPPDKTVPPYHPDDVAPDPFTTYIFSFRDVTGLSDPLVQAQKMKAQVAAPLFWLDEGVDFTLKLTNLGLQIRPDLIDSHTLHFHGFRNAIPIFDGEPLSSVAVPIIRDLTYFYRPRDPGTYMYHCHFEETEHVHMGMVGPVFIRPELNALNPGHKYAYNDPATEYDREFVMFLHEVWTEAHWCDSHIQLPDWSEYRPEFWLLNGRVYPDTLAPHGGGTDPITGDLIPPAGHPELQYQPVSSLVQANEGDRVLLRFINLGFIEQSMTLAGIRMRVVGKDATLLRGRNGSDLGYVTQTVSIGVGESVDAIFVAPSYHGPGSYDTYLLYNRNYGRLSNGGYSGYGGQMTEVRVFPTSTLPPQTSPNM